MSTSKFQYRLKEELKRTLSEIVEFEARDPIIRAAFPTVMEVKLSPDNRYATVYVALGAADVNRDDVMEAFQRDRGFFRSQLAPLLTLRHIPALEFRLDESVERSIRFDSLLHEDDATDAPTA
ncbi:30S ribosome-binding factor RbfA [Candidatus Bipolaricaulota bacterium]|nr:30S ribosome-binding factor RbfA [Candidatus Bipolaricaulota bacterium]